MGIRPHHAERNPLRQIDSEPPPHHSRHSLRFGMWQKLQHFFTKDDATHSPIECPDDEQWPQTWADRQDSNKDESSTRPLAVGLPRQATFRRQNSERRDRLLPIEPGHAERRAVSSTRHVSMSLPRRRATSSPPDWDPARTSAPAVTTTNRADVGGGDAHVTVLPPFDSTYPGATEDLWSQNDDRPPRPPSRTSSDESHYPQMPFADDKAELRDELDHRWILNLSMHFRDKSDREKFFVTYAQTPSFWRRVTVSCDYRNAEPGSLEMDLKELQFQRDKSLQIYESIRDSLPEIQFYDTVTNLKLETTDGRLHVHVTEDVNEIIPYPPRATVSHILNDEEFRPMQVRESELTFDSHLSGFVYKVRHKGKTYIKKEIPGPDTVDEFLYEINALHAIHDSHHVIKLEAIVLDDTESVVKGLLITYAEKGAIVDLLYDHRGSIAWEDRCRWAEQAVRGLSEIHEEGYVQGDFTLSNIVVDEDGNAKIIDINRRGCPVGWEPPEIATKIASNQRISMYIGEKSDIYQLGMTLWALAMDDDEPERHVPPLSVDEFPSEVPEWYQDIVRICLSSRPRDRLSAKELVDLFPEAISRSCEEIRPPQKPALKVRTMKKYIDPADAVERDDILRLSSNLQEQEAIPYSPESSRDDYTFTYPKSSNYEFESDLSGYDRPRGRRPPTNYAHLGSDERHHWESEDERPTPTEDFEPNIVAISPGMDREFDELELDGHPYLISRRTFNDEELEILERRAEVENSMYSQNATEEKAGAEASESSDSSRPIPVRRPSLLAATSATSESTPRNSQDLLTTLAKFEPPDLPSGIENSNNVEEADGIVDQDDDGLVDQDDDELVDQDNDGHVDQDNDELVDQDNDKLVDQDNDGHVDQDNDKLVDQDNDGHVDQDNDKLVDQDNDGHVDQDNDKLVDQDNDGHVDQDNDELVDQENDGNAPQIGSPPAADENTDSPACSSTQDLPENKSSPPLNAETSKPPSLPFADSGYDEPLNKFLGSDRDVQSVGSIAEEHELEQQRDDVPQSVEQSEQAADTKLDVESALEKVQEPVMPHTEAGQGDRTPMEVAPSTSLSDLVEKRGELTLLLGSEQMVEAKSPESSREEVVIQ